MKLLRFKDLQAKIDRRGGYRFCTRICNIKNGEEMVSVREGKKEMEKGDEGVFLGGGLEEKQRGEKE